MNANELKNLSDKELNKVLWDAIEQKYGFMMKLIREESNRRVREA